LKKSLSKLATKKRTEFLNSAESESELEDLRSAVPRGRPFGGHEVEEVLANTNQFRFLEKGERQGENVFIALGRSDAGRYLTVLFVYKKTREALILSARDMAAKERKQYGKK
jgi:hypothetical protein